jgi:rSAM/selenodomain-associated transferase 1
MHGTATTARTTNGTPRCGVAVMAKASIPGRAKTRLVPPLDDSEAAAFNTVFLKDVFANISAAGRYASIGGYAAGGPAGSEAFFHDILPAEAGYFECWFGDFGACLRHATWELFDRRHEGAVVLNADSPTLPTELLVRTAEVLAQPGDRAVLGPSDDGGYYLLGLKRRHQRMFEDIDWSTERVSEQTLARAEELGLTVDVLPAWYDVDDAAALRTLHDELFENRCYAGDGLRGNDAAHTVALMRTLLTRSDLARRLGVGTESGLSAEVGGGEC